MAEENTFRSEVTELVEAGWRIESETPERMTLFKRNFGSAKIHIIIWFVVVDLITAIWGAETLRKDDEMPHPP